MKTIIDQIQPTGFLKNYLSYASELTDAPIEFHLGAGLTALATACGSHVIFPGFGGRRSWPNLYTLLIAPSGLYRKSTSLGIAEDILAGVDSALILSGEQSREKFLSLLKSNPNVLYPISEFSAVLSLWSRDYSAGFKEMVTDLFDCRQEYTRQTLKDGKTSIKCPSLNILAASTMDWLREKLTEGDMRGGLMGRFLMVPGITRGQEHGLTIVTDKEAKTALTDFLKAIHEMPQAWVDLSKVIEGYNNWVVYIERDMEAHGNPELIGLQSRLSTHGLKLAVLLTVSDQGVQSKYVMSVELMDKAMKLTEWLRDRASEIAETGFCKSKTEVLAQKLLNLAGRNGGVVRGDALKGLHISSREFDQILKTVIDRGEIRVLEEKTNGRPKLILSRVKPCEESNVRCEERCEESTPKWEERGGVCEESKK